MIAADGVFRVAVAIGPAVKLLDDPRHLADGRIGKAVTQCLRARSLLDRIAGVLFLIPAQPLQRDQLGRSQVRWHRIGQGANDHVDMDARTGSQILAADFGRDGRAPVSALCEIARVSQRQHQIVPDLGDAVHPPAGFGRLARKGISGERRDDEVIVFGERADHVHKFQHRTGPAMREQQRPCGRIGRADMDEMDIHPVQFDQEIGQCVQRGFAASPVIFGRPISSQFFHIGQWYALVPILHRFLFRKTGERELGFEAGQMAFGNLYGEGARLTGHAFSPVRQQRVAALAGFGNSLPTSRARPHGNCPGGASPAGWGWRSPAAAWASCP